MSEPIYFSIVDRNSWKTCVGGVWNDTFQQENGFHRWERIERGEGREKKEPASNNSPRSQAMKISLVDRAE